MMLDCYQYTVAGRVARLIVDDDDDNEKNTVVVARKRTKRK